MTYNRRRVMDEEDKRMENAIKRELEYKQKIANLFPDHDANTDIFPLEEKRWKALISKRNRSTGGILDCSQTTTCKYVKVSQETFESDEQINARGTISRSNSNVKRQKALVSKNMKSAGRIIDCGATACIHTEVPQEMLKHLESHGQSTIFKSNSSLNAEIPSSAPNAALPRPNHFPSMTSPLRPSLSPAYNTYSRRKKNTESSRNSGFVSPRQKLTPNIRHYCKDCEVYCSGDLCYEQHLRGNKHKVKLQCLGDSSVNGKNKQVIRCDSCEISCQDEALLELHLKGQKHKAKQHEMEHGGKNEDENGKQFWCKVCQVPCTNGETFMLHLKGKKHRRQLCVLDQEKKKAEAQDSVMPSFVSTQQNGDWSVW
ncbi:putative protein isoform X1 [Capsicum galapagoense]